MSKGVITDVYICALYPHFVPPKYVCACVCVFPITVHLATHVYSSLSNSWSHLPETSSLCCFPLIWEKCCGAICLFACLFLSPTCI